MLLIKILLSLVLLVFILVMLIMLVPFNYQVSANSEEKQFMIKVSWLFHLIGFSRNYKFQEGINDTLSIFGINFALDQDRVGGNKKNQSKNTLKRKIKREESKTRRSLPAGLINRETFKYILYHFEKLLKHLLPRKFEASGVIGFDDPYHTSMFCSFTEVFRGFRFHDIQIQYVFYEEVYQARFYLEGKIRLVYVVYIALKLMLNRTVRKMIFNNS